MNAARDLRTKADNVERALAKRITCMDTVRIKLENELVDVKKKKLQFFISEYLHFIQHNLLYRFDCVSACVAWPKPRSSSMV